MRGGERKMGGKNVNFIFAVNKVECKLVSIIMFLACAPCVWIKTELLSKLRDGISYTQSV